MLNSAPQPYELEISVFGPGIGESIVAHIGDGDWIVVDSCVDKTTNKPVAIQYLQALGVDISERVRMVVATHWHDDHIRGLANILELAKNARFATSAAYDPNQLARIARLGAITAANASATDEYSRIVEILHNRAKEAKQRASGYVRANANQRLLNLPEAERTVTAEIYALSPSPATINLAYTELEHALKLYKDRRRPPKQGPNQLCVVLWIRVGDVQAILGADLEYVGCTTEGWSAIVTSKEKPECRARLFKVPHHGSDNAHSGECWEHLLCSNPVAVVTPYAPSRLPKSEDLERLCSYTPHVYLTSDYHRFKPATYEHTVDKMLRRGGLKFRALEGRVGQVRLRMDARDAGSEPKVELDDGAEHKCA